MKRIFHFAVAGILAASITACGARSGEPATTDPTATAASTNAAGQSAVQDDESAKDVVKVAASNKDFTTLVAAVKQAGLVDALSNAGPFTVFAPTNAAFDKVPKETLEALMQADKKADLQNILQYHVYVGMLSESLLQDGQTFNQVNGGNITISKKDGKTIINGTATIVATVKASNGIIHVIDGVLLPK
ncbi:Uncaracterized surface protein containing fasciclin (FAS1) repeats [Cnuella takakiae]|uniref:Uncaracterized surface protein containing fasciclin (FAS1) repeats n=1 Tax=Cnuella takakiae TaxID=1302690 RepID=A0A1M4X8P3_9BACT|nr:fasciclin domain-containing protein [Cnuella takakiae]OLY91497.1 fasciclin [Cnuella takakiae]SHE89878.1 Uncaracterized surface protein containing fasciclin (FAS1) repeats [Cnuella takakiae]